MVSPYKKGADDGFRLGIYFIVLFFSSIFSAALPVLGLLTVAMAIGVPVVVALMLSRYNRECRRLASFSMLWMQGVMMFLCGMLIAGAALVIYMKWINPDFIAQQWRAMAAFGKQSAEPAYNNLGLMAQQMIDNGMVPSPMAVVVEFVLLAVTSGSVLSIIIAAFIASSNRRHRRCLPDENQQPETDQTDK